MKRFTQILVAAAFMTGQLAIPLRARAQEDNFDSMFEEDAGEPGANGQIPPPPPAPDFNGAAGGLDAGTNPNAATGTQNPNAAAAAAESAGANPNFQAPPLMGGRGGKIAKAKPVAKDAKKPPISTAGPEDITNANYPDLIESFDYPNADITDVVKAISELTGKNFIVDPSVRGKITIMAPTQITVAEAYKAFLSALAINGFTVVPSGKFLKLVPTRTAARSNIETYSGAYYPNSDVMITRIVKLKHISADEVNKNLRFLPTKDGEMNPYTPTNSLIITDYGSNIDRIMKILNELDQAGFEEQMVVMPVKNAKAKDMADLIMQIINKEPKANGANNGFNAGIPRFPRAGGTGTHNGMPEELSLVAPDDRTNSIIVVGNKTGVEKIRMLLTKLDYKLDPTENGGVYVYYVRYGDAEKISTTLQGVTSGAPAGGAASSPTANAFGGLKPFVPPSEQHSIFGGDVKINADKANNSLVISASKQDFQIVLSLLAKIDIPRDQVYVETYIVEMNSNRVKDVQFNIAKYTELKDANGNSIAGPPIGFIGSSPQTLASLLAGTANGAILGFGSGKTLTVGGGQAATTSGTTGTTTTAGTPIPSLLALINFLVTTGDTNVLSTPQILALNNEESEIEVGQKVATGVQTATGASNVTTSSPTYEDATIKLNITPYISPDSEDVRMKLTQTLKQPSGSPSGIANTINLDERSIKTNIVVGNGDTAVLGGLIKDQQIVQEQKVPLLGDIPVLGWLFRSSHVQTQKVNLMVFLSPHIIRDAKDHHKLLNAKRNERIQWIKRNNDGRDPFGEAVSSLPMRGSADVAHGSRGARKIPTTEKLRR